MFIAYLFRKQLKYSSFT